MKAYQFAATLTRSTDHVNQAIKLHAIMLKPLWLLATVAAFAACAPGAPPAGGGVQPERVVGRYVPGELIVKFRPGTSRDRIGEILAAQRLSIKREMGAPDTYLIQAIEAHPVPDLIRRLRAYGEVQSADPNWIRRIGPLPEPPRTKPAPNG